MGDELEAYRVKQGECIASIAFERGMHPDTIWKNGANAELAKLRGTGYVLQPEDVLQIPAKQQREEMRAIDKRHRFKRKGVPEKLILQFLEDDEPRKGAKYVLEIDGRPAGSGKLDKDGRLEEWIPPDARKGMVLLDGDEETELELGRLNPPEDDEGFKDRLHNLGYFDGICGEQKVEDAVGAFQEHEKKEPTGEVDGAVRDELEAAHGS